MDEFIKLVFFSFQELQDERFYAYPTNISPFIVAIGTEKSFVTQYMVAVDGYLIPTKTTFLEAFDILFKTHFIFNLDYDADLRMLFKFIQHYLYKIPISDIPSTVSSAYSKISNVLGLVG
jgi:hypothetical protein